MILYCIYFICDIELYLSVMSTNVKPFQSFSFNIYRRPETFCYFIYYLLIHLKMYHLAPLYRNPTTSVQTKNVTMFETRFQVFWTKYAKHVSLKLVRNKMYTQEKDLKDLNGRILQYKYIYCTIIYTYIIIFFTMHISGG